MVIEGKPGAMISQGIAVKDTVLTETEENGEVLREAIYIKGKAIGADGPVDFSADMFKDELSDAQDSHVTYSWLVPDNVVPGTYEFEVGRKYTDGTEEMILPRCENRMIIHER